MSIIKQNRKKFHATVELKSPFPGGDSSWVKNIETNINQSNQLGKGARKGRYLVRVQFVLDADGVINDIKPLTNNGYGMEAGVTRVLKKSVKWLPAAQGVPVIPYRTSSSTPLKSNE